MNKTGLVVEGGGMKCAYNAGILDRFLDKNIHFDYCIGVSAGSALCHPVSLNGHMFYDGGVSDSIPVERAFQQGCDRVVVILSNPRSYVKQPENFRFLYKHMLRKYPAMITALDQRHLMYRQNIADVIRHEKAGEVFVLAPSKDTPLSAYESDSAVEQSLYDLGIADFDTNFSSLQQFLC